MFKFLKGAFKQKTETAELTLEEIEPFVDKNVYGKIDSFKNDFSKKTGEINDEIIVTKEKLGKLEVAELKNKKIEPRIMQIMQGNREAYLRKIGMFLSHIKTPNDYEQINQFCSDFTESLEILNKTTTKPYYILQEFFRNESRDVALSIKKIENIVLSLDELDKQSALRAVNKIYNKRDLILKNVDLKKEFRTKIEKIKTGLENLGKEKQQVEKEIYKLKNSEEYLEYQNLLEQRDELAGNVKAHKNQVDQVFAVLDRALRKYHRISLEPQVIGPYLNNAVSAMKKDTDLKILDVLQKLKQALNKNTIEDKKKEKIIENIDSMNSAYIKIFLEKLAELESNMEGLDKTIATNHIMRDISEHNYKLEHKNDKIQQTNQEMEETQHKLDNLKTEEIKEEIEKQLSDVSGFGVTISLEKKKKAAPEPAEKPVEEPAEKPAE